MFSNLLRATQLIVSGEVTVMVTIDDDDGNGCYVSIAYSLSDSV